MSLNQSTTGEGPLTQSPPPAPSHTSQNHFDRLFKRMGKLFGDLTWTFPATNPLAPPQSPQKITESPSTPTLTPVPEPKAVSDKTQDIPSSTPKSLSGQPLNNPSHEAFWTTACRVLAPMSIVDLNRAQGEIRTAWATWSQHPDHRMRVVVCIHPVNEWEKILDVVVEHQQWEKGRWCPRAARTDLALDIKTLIMFQVRFGPSHHQAIWPKKTP